MIPTQPLEIEDFSGGITDFFIDGRPDQGEKMENLFINPNRKLFTRWGSEAAVPEQIPLGLFRISYIDFLNDDLFAFSQRRAYYDNAGSWAEFLGPNGDPAFNSGDINSQVASAEWEGHMFLTNSDYASPQKIYKDENGDYQLRNAGLPEFNTTGLNITPPPGAGASYVYTFIYKYQYKVADVTFIDRGPTYQSDVIQGGTITTGNGTSIDLSTTLTANENWDDSAIEIEIYRTLNGGDDFFLVAAVPLGTANYVDETEDATLNTSLGLYTNEGALPSLEPPPLAKFVHVVNGTAYWANLQTNAEDDEYLVRQSVPGEPDSVPADFFTRAEQKIKGLSSIYDRPILMCDRYIYRIDNIIQANGVGNMDLRRIDDEAGCVSNNSIVATHKGLFWAGRVGFYWTDGFKVRKISRHLPDTYQLLVTNPTRASRIQGDYDASNERVIWTACRDEGDNEPDTLYSMDLKWFELHFERDEACFTTVTGGEFFRPTAIGFNNNKLYRGDTRGFVLEHAPNYFTDPRIDVITPVANWERQTIIHDYLSCFMDFGTKFIRKFVPRILISADNATNLSLAINSSNDNDRVKGELAPIRYRDNITWGEDLPLWGDPAAKWNSQGLIEQWRRFPAGGLRCNYKQIQLTNAQVQIVTSDLLGTATVNGTTKTATLGGSSKWVNNAIDYVIAFENDDYTEEFVINQRTDTTITFNDPAGKAPTGVFEWIIRGKPKGEVLKLNGYVIHYAMLSKSHTPFGAGSLGSSPS